MQRAIDQAVEITLAAKADPTVDRHAMLIDGAKIVRDFLINLQGTLSAWKPWMKYAISAVIAILNTLIGDK